MAERGATSGEQGAGAGDAPPAPRAADEVVEAEVVDGAQVDGEVVDAEVVDEAAGQAEPAASVADGGDEAEAPKTPGSDPLAEAQRERDEYLELARRARAEFENYRRRTSGQLADAERRGKASLARGILPALDNLQRALTAAGVDPAGGPEIAGEQPSEEVSARDALAAGVALVLRELQDALERAGVSGYDPLGERFDPTLHEAVATGQVDGRESGTVLETLERGYRVDGQVLRPAKVIVAG